MVRTEEPNPRSSGLFPASYVLPIRRTVDEDISELTAYLRWLNKQLELIVVDGSPPVVFSDHMRAWQELRHVAPRPELWTPNGKVWGVLTGLQLASNERVVIADDDVRYDAESLERVLSLLDSSDIVRPQNYFDPMPWHAKWDTARTLLNRVTGGDWPGTLAVRRSVVMRTGGYDGDCLFENLELVRTVVAAGGKECVALDVFVPRLPTTVRHFWSQRMRQAYDEFARPWRLGFQLALAPSILLAFLKRPEFLAGTALLSIAAAELGRRRDGGVQVFPASASLWAPLWFVERAVCAWLAVLSRVRYGGVRYSGGVISKAATPLSELKKRRSAPAQELQKAAS